MAIDSVRTSSPQQADSRPASPSAADYRESQGSFISSQSNDSFGTGPVDSGLYTADSNAMPASNTFKPRKKPEHVDEDFKARNGLDEGRFQDIQKSVLSRRGDNPRLQRELKKVVLDNTFRRNTMSEKKAKLVKFKDKHKLDEPTFVEIHNSILRRQLQDARNSYNYRQRKAEKNRSRERTTAEQMGDFQDFGNTMRGDYGGGTQRAPDGNPALRPYISPYGSPPTQATAASAQFGDSRSEGTCGDDQIPWDDYITDG